ncbi:hypothetical protein RAC65_00070 [Pantoea sp. BS_8]|uniref:hypothetical protein n=1 Tax=Pantoea sp. BS_8 TaxID=3055781 RepID=UPI0035C1BE66
MPVSVMKSAVKTASLAAVLLAGLQGATFAKDLPSRAMPGLDSVKDTSAQKTDVSTSESAVKLAAWHHHLEINPGCNDPSSGLGCTDDDNA